MFLRRKKWFRFQGIYVLSPFFAFFDQTIALLKKAQAIKCVKSKIKIVADFSCCHDHEALHPVCESESELHAEEERGTKRTIIVALFGLKKMFPPTNIGLFSFNAKIVFSSFLSQVRFIPEKNLRNPPVVVQQSTVVHISSWGGFTQYSCRLMFVLQY